MMKMLIRILLIRANLRLKSRQHKFYKTFYSTITQNITIFGESTVADVRRCSSK